jgi:polyisoprenoid-binding protein YceI
MNKIIFSKHVFVIAAIFMFATYAWSAPQEAVAPEVVVAPEEVVATETAVAPDVEAFPAPGQWEFTFKPETSFISYFLAGNIHDTLGYVRTMQGSASASIDPDGRMTTAVVQFTFAAKVMNSDDEARDKRMFKKFMEIHIYPEISFRAQSAGMGLDQAAALAGATKEQPIAFDLAGALTIHGTTKEITIPATAYPENGLLITEGTTILQLQDYTIKNPSWLFMRTEDTVKIAFHIELQPQS